MDGELPLEAVLRHLRQGDWERAHALVRDDESPRGCWAHGIVHLMEGDLDNARYWYRRAQRAWPASADAAAEVALLAAECKASARSAAKP